MPVEDEETKQRWQTLVAAIEPELKRGLRDFKRKYSSPAGPHSRAAGDQATQLEHQRIYRKQQHSLWKEAVRQRDKAARIRLVRTQIEDWGGIRKNREALIEQYALQPASKLISRGSSGISSWSKALAIRDPRQFAVYDARVALTLNALQVILVGRVDFLFPVPPTQNRTIEAARRRLRNHIGDAVRLRGADVYERYLELLKRAKGGHSLHAAELYLFHVAPDLAGRL